MVDQTKLNALLAENNAIIKAMTPEEREAMFRAQRESWVRGEMALSKLVKKHVGPNGEIVYDDYESYCFD